MAKRNSTYRTKARPYLTSEEVLELTGATRRTLLTLEERGLVTPHRFEERGGALGWTFAQVRLIRLAETLRAQGVPFGESAQAAESGYLQDAAENRSLKNICEARRSLKRLLFERRQESDLEPDNNTDRLCLRYIHQRWLATVAHKGIVPPGTDAYVAARLLAVDVAQCVGWCITDSGGTIMPMGPSGRAATFVELASQPYPTPIAGMAADGGCYRAFGGSCAFGEDGNCLVCPRYGKEITPGDRIRWTQLSQAAQAGEIPSPIVSNAAAFGLTPSNEKASMDDFLSGNESIVAARPAFIPIEASMPPGIGAAVLPSGTWLCLRASEREIVEAQAQMRMLALTMRSAALTDEEARESCSQLEESLRKNGVWWRLFRGDECMGPLTGLPLIEDRELLGWTTPVDLADVHLLRAPTMTGLFPGDDRCMVVKELPDGDYELQILVDIESLPSKLSPKKKKKKGRGFFTLGAAPAVLETAARKPDERTRCRECGAVYKRPADIQVAVCPLCGAAKVIGRSSIRQANTLAAEAEDALLAGHFEEARKLANLAMMKDADFAEAHWLLGLALHEVRWTEGNGVGGRRAVVGKADGSLLDDEDLAAAIRLALPTQWGTYSHQLHALEASRVVASEQEALGPLTVLARGMYEHLPHP